VTKHLRKRTERRNGLFWLTVSEVSIQAVDPLLWAYDTAKYHGGRGGCWKTKRKKGKGWG
jgi:hypothetical protein